MSRLLVDASDMIKEMTNIDHLTDMQTHIAADHISEEIEHKTFPYVPLDKGYLQDAYYTKLTNYSPLQMDLWYSSYSNKGYDYAARQHEEKFNHPIKGTDHYMVKGVADTNAESLYGYHIAKVL